MPITFLCPHCGQELRAHDQHAGKKVTCKCGRLVTIPGGVHPDLVDLFRTDLQKGETPPQKAGTSAKEPVPPGASPVRKLWSSRTLWAGGGLVLVVLLGANLVLLLFGRNSRQGETPPPDDKPTVFPDTPLKSSAPTTRKGSKPVPGEEGPIRQVLEQKFKLTGTVTPEIKKEKTEALVGDNPWSYLRWELKLSLVNGSSYPIEVGKDLFLFQGNGDLSSYNGVALFWGVDLDAKAILPYEFYGLSNNYQIQLTSGKYLLLRGNRLWINEDKEYLKDGKPIGRDPADRPRFGPAARDAGLGFGQQLAAGQTSAFTVELDQGVWLPEGGVPDKVQVVLPELTVATRPPAERYRLMVSFQKPDTGLGPWPIAPEGLVWVKVETDELARLVTDSRSTITRICAANWLAETSPERCRQALAQVGGSLQEGQLLETCLKRLAHQKDRGLAENAQRLLRNPKVKPRIRALAADYLGMVRAEGGLAALANAVGDPDKDVAHQALLGLEAYGEAAADTLLQLLVNASDDKRADDIAPLLVKVKSPALLEKLQKEAVQDHGAALRALVLCEAPMTFPFFRQQAQQEKRPEWKGWVALGLIKSGGDKAFAEVLKMLEKDDKEDPPSTANPLQQNPLVEALVVAQRDWASTQAILDLQGLADKKNLRAVQILTNLGQPAALGVLQAIARKDKEETQVLIALDGLANNKFAMMSVLVFREALRHRNKDIVRKAIEGLGNSGDPAAEDWLRPFCNDPDLQKEANEALKKVSANKAKS